jgi:hypothetical protein
LQRDKQKVEKSLRSKGFRRDNTHHRFFIYWTQAGRKTTIKTKTSHGTSSKSIGASLLGKMADQCRLDMSEFLDFVDCPLDQKGYEKILEQKGAL